MKDGRWQKKLRKETFNPFWKGTLWRRRRMRKILLCFQLITKRKKKLKENHFLLLVYERALLVRRGTGAPKTAVPQVST